MAKTSYPRRIVANAHLSKKLTATGMQALPQLSKPTSPDTAFQAHTEMSDAVMAAGLFSGMPWHHEGLVRHYKFLMLAQTDQQSACSAMTTNENIFDRTNESEFVTLARR